METEEIKTKFLGIITQIIGNDRFILRANRDTKQEIGQIVGINISENTYLLAVITAIETDYFLRDEREYFTSLSVDNKLEEIANEGRKPKFANLLQAESIGIFSYNQKEKTLVEKEKSIHLFTSKIFQAIEELEFKDIVKVFGLTKQGSGLNIGEMLYPKYSDFQEVNIPITTFDSHTLISGTTGAGKSRLSALLANELTKKESKVSILDPHHEYQYLVDPQIQLHNVDIKETKKYLEEMLKTFKKPKFDERFETLIIDEVHTLLKEADSRELLELLLRTSRKFGVSLIFITQNAEDIPNNMKELFQNQFSFRGDNSKVKYLKDQTCMCSLRGGKLPFPMRVNTIELRSGTN